MDDLDACDPGNMSVARGRNWDRGFYQGKYDDDCARAERMQHHFSPG